MAMHLKLIRLQKQFKWPMFSLNPGFLSHRLAREEVKMLMKVYFRKPCWLLKKEILYTLGGGMILFFLLFYCGKAFAQKRNDKLWGISHSLMNSYGIKVNALGVCVDNFSTSFELLSLAVLSKPILKFSRIGVELGVVQFHKLHKNSKEKMPKIKCVESYSYYKKPIEEWSSDPEYHEKDFFDSAGAFLPLTFYYVPMIWPDNIVGRDIFLYFNYNPLMIFDWLLGSSREIGIGTNLIGFEKHKVGWELITAKVFYRNLSIPSDKVEKSGRYINCWYGGEGFQGYNKSFIGFRIELQFKAFGFLVK